MLTITEIEDLLIARIKAELPYLAEVSSYKGQLEKEIAELVLRTPAVLVSLQELPGEPASFAEFGALSGYALTYTFSLAVVCRDLRGEAASRRGDTGAYRILDDLFAALRDHILDNGLQPLAYNKAEAILITKEVVIFAANYSVVQED
jgi:phage gp37-like protein